MNDTISFLEAQKTLAEQAVKDIDIEIEKKAGPLLAKRKIPEGQILFLNKLLKLAKDNEKPIKPPKE